MAYDALKTYGVKQVPLAENKSNIASSFTWDDFKKLVHLLQTRSLTGHAARDQILFASQHTDIVTWNSFYRKILLKDFKCGVTKGTINKILEKNGNAAKRYIIPAFSCQLAKDGKDHPKKITGRKLLDLKLDGIRLLTILDKDANTVIQYTRDGRVNTNFTHISKLFEQLLPHITQSMVFDGEVVSKNFQILMRQLKRKSNVNTSDAVLALFDCLPFTDFMLGECKSPQTARHASLIKYQPLLDTILTKNEIIILSKEEVDLDTNEGQDTFKKFNNDAIENQYEGIMIKDLNATYKTKRTDAWLKIKPVITVDLEVIGFESGKSDGKFANTLGGMICKGIHNGKTVLVVVGSGYSEELRDEIWNNKDKVLGRIVEIKGDMLTLSEDSDDIWSLRFPRFERFRGWSPGEKI